MGWRRLTRGGVALAAGSLLLVGVALLVLPGPGLLLVLAGSLVLAAQFPAVARYVGPVRRRAMRAARESVSTPLRITGPCLAAAALLAAGPFWGVMPDLPFGGWPTGAGLILSSVVLVALLVYSYRTTRTGAGDGT
ncbi:PGPGW domain-containing protein [Streptomyces sp. DSM 41972]|uniref:PGPGW domain-containing protein n=1 Tax=Streptomyces althioticus subsp. attaecolombicae TaxID=3075534 RepID=A0ABU3I078_9ACTN|nr:PGPGW domain-containing protein [Streptomyces sp. DSM 41972]